MTDPIRVVTWNVQGRDGLDIDGAAAVIAATDADIVVVQEVQRRQASSLAAKLGWRYVWARKHWPVVLPAEGAAIFAPRALTSPEAMVLTSAPPWSWRRRIALIASVAVGTSPLVVVNVHLSPHGLAERRRAEVDALLQRLGQRRHQGRVLIAGDFNDTPSSRDLDGFRAAGLVDAWEAADPSRRSGDGCTNWTRGDRSGRLPTQRIDGVFVPEGWQVSGASVPTDRHAELAALSDHLPLTVDVSAMLRHPSRDPEMTR